MILRAVCVAGASLTVDPRVGAVDTQVSIARLGGLEALLSALRRHKSNAVVAKQACAALRNLAVNGVVMCCVRSLD